MMRDANRVSTSRVTHALVQSATNADHPETCVDLCRLEAGEVGRAPRAQRALRRCKPQGGGTGAGTGPPPGGAGAGTPGGGGAPGGGICPEGWKNTNARKPISSTLQAAM